MRLLQASTLLLHEFHEQSIPAYVILSHTWEDDEVLFKDIENGSAAQRKGYEKVVNSCKQARLDGFSWIWIDTCCIDKTSSSELSEAINSMYRWYQEARICYAYLADVDSLVDAGDVLEQFKTSRWLTRGWTLQELVAPDIVEFYDLHWNEIGTKSSLKIFLTDATGIDARVMAGEQASVCNVATRLSWASRRQTTRTEDLAYCMLGLLEVNMPLLYGEGINAFRRLQEEVLKNSTDYTMFAWRDHDELPAGSGILAPSFANFCMPRFCTSCTATGAFEYNALCSLPFTSIDRHGEKSHSVEQTGTYTSRLPAIMGGRFQMTFPTHPIVGSGNVPHREAGLLLYLGYQTADSRDHPGSLVCLELQSDWDRREEFQRRDMELVSKGNLSSFALKQLVLISWRVMSLTLRNSLWASMSARFVFENWPLCLTAKEVRMNGRSAVVDPDFGHEGGRFGSLLESYSPLDILCEHGHAEDDVIEKFTIQCVYDRRGPTCSITRVSAPEDSASVSLVDRAELVVASQACKILVKIKRMTDDGNTLPNFKLIVDCKRID